MTHFTKGVKGFLQAIANTSEEYSDLTITCGTRSFKVHKIIVCSQCKLFAAMVNGNWIESAAQTITLQDEDVEVVQDAMTYLYTAKIPRFNQENEESAPKKSPDPIRLAKLYIFGDKWNIPAMQQYVVYVWDSTMTKQCTVPDVLEAIPMVWRSILNNDDKLKIEIVETVRRNFEAFSRYKGFTAAINQVPEASSAIIKSIARFNNRFRIIAIPRSETECHCNWEYDFVQQCQSCRQSQEA